MRFIRLLVRARCRSWRRGRARSPGGRGRRADEGRGRQEAGQEEGHQARAGGQGSCSAPPRRRRRWRRAPSASTPRAALPAPLRCPSTAPAWQAMRLSRNRNWGHPKLVALVEKLAVEAKAHDGWPGLLVGDLSQPRGGPMLTGHASHQVGLDADIWLTPMPDRRLSEKEREDLSATSMLAADKVSVDPKVWTDAHVRLLKRAASYPAVERIFVHPAIKKALCEAAAKDRSRRGPERSAPIGATTITSTCASPARAAAPTARPSSRSPRDDGCGDELTRWLALVKPKPQPTAPTPPAKPRPVETRAHARSAARRMPRRAVERHRCAGASGHASAAGQGARGSQGVRHEIGQRHARATLTMPARPWAAPRSAAPAW